MEIARLAAADASASGRKLAKDILQDSVELFEGLASNFQPASFDNAVLQDWAKTPAAAVARFGSAARATVAGDNNRNMPIDDPLTYRSCKLAGSAA